VVRVYRWNVRAHCGETTAHLAPGFQPWFFKTTVQHSGFLLLRTRTRVIYLAMKTHIQSYIVEVVEIL